MLNEILGTITYKAQTYRMNSIDKDALEKAGVLVMVVALLQSLFGILKGTFEFGTILSPVDIIFAVILNVILGLLVWVVVSWFLVVISRALGGRAGLSEMLRVAGFVQVFGLLGFFTLITLFAPGLIFIDLLVTVLIALLCLSGYFLAARVVAGLPQIKAFLAAFLTSVGGWLVLLLVDRIAGVVLPDLMWSLHFVL